MDIKKSQKIRKKMKICTRRWEDHLGINLIAGLERLQKSIFSISYSKDLKKLSVLPAITTEKSEDNHITTLHIQRTNLYHQGITYNPRFHQEDKISSNHYINLKCQLILSHLLFHQLNRFKILCIIPLQEAHIEGKILQILTNNHIINLLDNPILTQCARALLCQMVVNNSIILSSIRLLINNILNSIQAQVHNNLNHHHLFLLLFPPDHQTCLTTHKP
jgi:hypothetical protein